MMVVAAAKQIIFFSLCVLPFCKLKAESFACSIKVAGIKIGTLNASHVKSNNIDYYSVISDVEISFIIKVKVYYKTVSKYIDSKLVESTVTSLINGKQYTSKTKWIRNKYLIDCNTYKYSYVDSSRTTAINWSVSKMYFEKPEKSSEVYAETYGKLNFLKELNSNEFKFEVTNSKQIYKYDVTQLLQSVEMINAIKNFRVERINKN